MSPLLLVKRPTDFVFFVWLAFVMSFVQADTRMVCALHELIRTARPAAASGSLVLIAAASLGVTVTTFLPRYAFARQAIAAAVLYFLAFASAGYAGARVRIGISPSAECGSDSITILIVVALTSSILNGVLNLISPHHADYAAVRERVLAYRRELERPPDMTELRDLLGKARDAAERASTAETSARYRQAFEAGVLGPLVILLKAANDTRDEYPEEFLKRIGHRHPGLAPADAVASISRAQRQIEQLWKSSPGF